MVHCLDVWVQVGQRNNRKKQGSPGINLIPITREADVRGSKLQGLPEQVKLQAECLSSMQAACVKSSIPQERNGAEEKHQS